MAPQDPSTLPPVVTGVVPNPAVNLGKNFSVTNSAVGVKTALPITTSTVITAQGLNINPLAGGKSKLTISDSGDINSAGALSFGNGNFTVSSAGVYYVEIRDIKDKLDTATNNRIVKPKKNLHWNIYLV